MVALIGLMLGVVVTSIGDGGREKQMENEARRLVEVVKLARDEAVLMSEELSLVIKDNSYNFQVLGEKQWQPLKDERALAPHTLHDGLALQLELDSYAFTPKQQKSSDSSAGRDDDNVVRIYLLSSDEVQPFTLYIKEQDKPDGVRFKVSVDQEGKISWQGPLDRKSVV